MVKKEINMKYLCILLPLVFLGCTTPNYDAFRAAHNGASEDYYCSTDGFLIHEYVFSSNDIYQKDLITNNAGIPTRCSVQSVAVNVKETVATGSLIGSVQ